MIKNKTFLVLTISLLFSIILAGCGMQSTPEASQSSDPQGALPTAHLEIFTKAPAPTETPQEVAPTEAATEAPVETPTESPAVVSTTSVSFTKDVFPIIQSRCVNCHGGERIEEGLLMRSYAELMTGSENGPVIVPGDPTNSLLVELVTSLKMPKRGPKLTPPQVQIITEWVAAGAPNN